MELDGAIAVVTGGTGAIGRSVIALLEQRGARAVAWDLFAESGSGDVITCDVGSVESVEEAMDRTVAEYGVPTVLVTVAAVSGGISPLATSANEQEWERVFTAPETWDRVMRTNVVGVANCMRSFARRVSVTGSSGAILNISSMSSGPVAEPGLAAYSASKAALNQLTRVAAAELGPLGIRVNAVGPGMMATPMGGANRPDSVATKNSDARPADFASSAVRYVPIEQRHGTGEDIAQAVVALLQTDWVTGQIVFADGGLTLRSPVTT
ncbi:SDR family NAD(P)-dependent oxidoreductase [Nocardia miyunensis]|uniref:SDR family NAD(P)-dependent oxidoreductase n=1 Tax=Nocardia miyunensis TaxID=282684 RepID=UPI000AFF6961|nr:SDR family oxidoreductase [Nocardia miyunensis]